MSGSYKKDFDLMVDKVNSFPSSYLGRIGLITKKPKKTREEKRLPLLWCEFTDYRQCDIEDSDNPNEYKD